MMRKRGRSKPQPAQTATQAAAAPALWTIEEAARVLRCSGLTLKTKKYRERHGIPVVRIGRRIFFRPETLARFIARSEETLPPTNGTSSAERKGMRAG